jgi:hypothetical protein
VYAVVAVGVAVLITMAPVGCAQPRDPPRLFFDESVGSDFQLLAEETWTDFLTVFEARTDCFGDVRLRAAHGLNSRGAYDPDSATVTVRVPGTRAMLQSALIHEWAHHIEFQCEEHQELRDAFTLAQGLPTDVSWRPDDNHPANTPTSAWADIPSEQYAEATIELVLGNRPIPAPVRVTQEAIRVVEEWAAGD